MTMTVAEAITGRQSIRAFLDREVPRATIARILEVAGRAPSGSNIQPWQTWVLTGAARQRLVDDLTARHARGDEGQREYNYYPVKWREPYLARRRACGWGLYKTLGLTRDDKAGMSSQHRQNFSFFGAPVGLIFALDRDMEPGSWLDMGMFLQSVMIAARGQGLETCPQAAFCQYHDVIRQHLGIGEDKVIICGMALGWADPAAKVNTFRTEREELGTFVTWVEG